MGRLQCVAMVLLLLFSLLCANWYSRGVRGPAGSLSGAYPPVVRCEAFPAAGIRVKESPAISAFLPTGEREALGWIDQVLLLVALGGGRERDRQGGPLAADISACHPSLTDAKRPVNCCPPRRDADDTVVDFQLPRDVATSQPRVRRPAHLLNPDEVAKYERAVGIMKSLPSDHPHSFTRQANSHCLYCTGSYDQVNSTALFKIHRSWLFFPWHRAYIYFHERILGKLVGDDTFALPYWNWDSPEGMVMPEPYTKAGMDSPERDSTHLPPRVADLNYRGSRESEGVGLREEQVATNLALMYHQMVSGAKKAELFMGCKMRAGVGGWCDGPGTIETAPHNTLHTWVGSGRNPEREAMGAFYSAARDTIFYAHHANIDRLWVVWKGNSMRGIPDHEPEFSDPEWLDTSFTFYDENQRLVRIKVRDLLDPAKLGYTYEDVPLPWLDARPDPAVPPEVARGILKARDEATSQLLTAGEFFSLQGGRALDTTVTTKVHRPKMIPNQRESTEEVLVVDGILVVGDRYAKFDVFVNLVGEVQEAAGPRCTEFAGTFVNVPRGAQRVDEKKAMEKKKATLKLGISELLGDLGAEEDEWVWVSLVPRGGTGADVTVDVVRIQYMR